MKHRDSLPEDVQRFILLGIPSVPYLEALLLLRADPARAWTCQEVAQRLYLSDKATQQVLSELAAAGVTRAGDDPGGLPAQDCASSTGVPEAPGAPSVQSVRYAPQRPELQQMIERLAEIYPRHIVAVSELIHSRGTRQNREQQFADAFVLRKENP